MIVKIKKRKIKGEKQVKHNWHSVSLVTLWPMVDKDEELSEIKTFRIRRDLVEKVKIYGVLNGNKTVKELIEEQVIKFLISKNMM